MSRALAMSTHPAKVCPQCGMHYHGAAEFCQKDGARLQPAAPADPFVGKVLLDQFRIDEAIGAGGMGTVYRAHQTTLGRDVAVKILHPELAQHPDATRRFHREARVATSLEHPNLVRVLLFGELPDDAGLYLVMEYLRGRSLTQVLREDGALEVGRAIHVATQVCAAIGMAHQQGIVHRDVKPENVMLVPRHGDPDFVKVLDFGIARVLWDEQTAMTQSGVIFGTARYISPEGASGEPTDARSDVYSIGTLVYQLLAGVTPFDASTPVAMLMKHIHDQPPPLRSVGHGGRVPPAIAEVVMRSLRKNPLERYSDAGDLAAALIGAAERSGVASPSSSRGSWSPRLSVPSATPTPSGVRPPGSHPPAHASDSIQVPGLPQRRGRRAFAMLAAFVLGAAGVVGVVQGVRHLSAEDPDDITALEARARAALAADHLDAPPGENVLELSARMLEREPRHPAAQEVRREAVLRLRERAQSEFEDERFDHARAIWQRVLVFAPGDPRATAALREIDEAEARAARPAPGVATVPVDPLYGEAATFVAVVPESEVEARDARFEVWRGRRRLRSIPGAAGAFEGQWTASYLFRTLGDHEVRFVAQGSRDIEYRVGIEVTRRGRSVASQGMRSTGATPNMGTTTPPTVPAMTGMNDQIRPIPPTEDGIDWTIPPPGSMAGSMTTSMMGTTMGAVPEPWTGTAF